ncbi:MAG TPA: LptF/LptG family permease [Longimicrobiales bacterium]|nr:LptF/LptG family permease [Longimicrobiales bacterium]
MRILTRYLLRAHLGPFVFALFALTGVLFVNTIARRFQDIAGKGLNLSVVLEVFALSLPHIVALTLPMAVLVAVLFAFAQLTADNEITALKASGTSLIRMIMPLLAVSFLVAGFMLWFNDRVLPETNHALKNLIMDIGAKTPTLELTEQVINPIRTQDYSTRYWLKAARIDGTTNRMEDVVIYDLSDTRKNRTVYADSGYLTLNRAQTDMLLTLYDGVMYETSEVSPGELQQVYFVENRVELAGVGTQLQRTADEYRSDREMSIAMMRQRVDTARIELARLREEARQVHGLNLDRILDGPAAEPAVMDAPSTGGYMPFRDPAMVGDDELAYRASLDAQRLANNAQTLQDEINRFQVEVHKKYAIPFACIIFVLLGAPLAVRFPRGGVGMVIAASLTIFSIYYISLQGGEALGDRGIVQPFWGPWAPNFLFGAIALWALSRLGRETSTTRGGGWDDLWLSMRGFVTAPLRRRRRAGRMDT